MESSVFMLKLIVDKFYEEAKMYQERIKELERKVELLTKQSEQEVKKKGIVVIGNDDDVYADEALAPPASSLAPIKEEKQIEIVETISTTEEENKQVNVVVDKSRKEYMKEYQRNYRKKQKENTGSL
jgi:predicted ATP-grasp superfamily ATP-dependent carboligase